MRAETASSSTSVWEPEYSSIVSHYVLAVESAVPPPWPHSGILRTVTEELLAGYVITREGPRDLDGEDLRDLRASRVLYEEKGASGFARYDEYLARKAK